MKSSVSHETVQHTKFDNLLQSRWQAYTHGLVLFTPSPGYYKYGPRSMAMFSAYPHEEGDSNMYDITQIKFSSKERIQQLFIRIKDLYYTYSSMPTMLYVQQYAHDVIHR